MIIMLAGLPGTGKSTIARELARILPAVVLDKDQIRAALFPPERISYTTAQDDFCLHVMLQTATYLLQQNPHEPVILDGRTFSRRYQVEQVERYASQLDLPLKIIECVCSDETAYTRLTADSNAGSHVAANRSYALYCEIKARFEPIRDPKILVNTDMPLAELMRAILEAIQR